MEPSPLAGQPAPRSLLVDVPRLVSAFYTQRADPSVDGRRVDFGTSGHRGSAFAARFNEARIDSIAHAIRRYRAQPKIDRPPFVGIDTHAPSAPALEVLAAHSRAIMIAGDDEYTPTPAVSHAILAWDRGHRDRLGDGIVITPSHNQPHGGPAQTAVTRWIEKRAYEYLEGSLRSVRRIAFDKASSAPTTYQHDFFDACVGDLGSVIDFEAIGGAKPAIGVDPLGGAGVHYWPRIADHDHAAWSHRVLASCRRTTTLPLRRSISLRIAPAGRLGARSARRWSRAP